MSWFDEKFPFFKSKRSWSKKTRVSSKSFFFKVWGQLFFLTKKTMFFINTLLFFFDVCFVFHTPIPFRLGFFSVMLSCHIPSNHSHFRLFLLCLDWCWKTCKNSWCCKLHEKITWHGKIANKLFISVDFKYTLSLPNLCRSCSSIVHFYIEMKN